MTLVAFARHLRELMEAAGLTARALSRESGVSNTTISAWLRGTTRPEADPLRRVAAVLGVPYARLREVADAAEGEPLGAQADAHMEARALEAERLLREVERFLRRSLGRPPSEQSGAD